MTFILVASHALKASKKAFPITSNQLIALAKSGSFREFSSTNNVKSVLNKRIKQNKAHSKLLRITVASGIFFVSSYLSLSSYYLSDSGDANSFRNFSSAKPVKNSSNISSDSSKQQSIFLLNEDEITRRLRNLEESYFVNRGNGVVRYDISQLPSNDPIEDDRSEAVITVPIERKNNEVEGGVVKGDGKEVADFYFWGVYDGHSGYYTSLKLRDELINYVVSELGSIYKPSEQNPGFRTIPSQELVDDAIKQGFLKLDEEIVNNSLKKLFEDPYNKQSVINSLAASSGSCGLLTFYDSSSQIFKVAVTGDSRALLGSLNEENQWTVKSLSVDQTGDNPEEVSRIQNAHPHEPTAVKNGRVLGSLQPSRAFGDSRYKVKDINGKSFDSLPEHLKVHFRSAPRNSKTPPYVTAEPVLTTTKIDPSKNDFVVIATDGLYELLSNEEIVGLVVKWLEKNNTTSSLKTSSSNWNSLFNSSDQKKLPKIVDVSDPKYKESQRPPFRNNQTSNQHEFILEDENVSTHLIRNALSLGGSKEYVSTLVSIPSPKSRKFRDDLTVTVVFFGDGKDSNDKNVVIGENEGGLEVNLKATRNGRVNAKEKL
jgi:pyruvate dehydrogenase phosphatase